MEEIDVLRFLDSTDIETQVDRRAFLYNLKIENQRRELHGKFRTHFSSKKILNSMGMSKPLPLIEPYIIADDLKKVFANLTGLDFSILQIGTYGNYNIEPDEPTNIITTIVASQVSDCNYGVRLSLDFLQKNKEKFILQATGFGNDYSPLETEVLNEDVSDDPWKIKHEFEGELKDNTFYANQFSRPVTLDEVSYNMDSFEEDETHSTFSHLGTVFDESYKDIPAELQAYFGPRFAIKRKIMAICAQEPHMDPVLLETNQDEDGVFTLNTPTDIHGQYHLRLCNNGTKLIHYEMQLEQDSDYMFLAEGYVLLKEKSMRIE